MSKPKRFGLQGWSRGHTSPLPLCSATYKKKNGSTTRDGNLCPGNPMAVRNENARLPVRGATSTTSSNLSANGSQRVSRSQRVPAVGCLGRSRAIASSDALWTRTEPVEQLPRAHARLLRTCTVGNAGFLTAPMAASASRRFCRTRLVCPRTPPESVASRRSGRRLRASNRTAYFAGPSMPASQSGVAAVLIGNGEE